MEVGFPDYGCTIQAEKTFKNFATLESAVAMTSAATMTSTELVFFGSLIDCSTMICRPDFSTLFGRNIAYATTLSCDSLDTDAIEAFVF